MPRLLIATKNAHKTAEIAEILAATFEISDLNAYAEIPQAIESGETFAENAILKAMEASRVFAGLVLSDDSGLEVDALGGAPGVRSARYSGEHSTDACNRAKLLGALAAMGVRGKDRSARFRCVMALAENGYLLGTFDGTVEGTILAQESGSGGFGYDAIFAPTGYCQTFAELSPTVKNLLSHRARALNAAIEALRAIP